MKSMALIVSLVLTGTAVLPSGFARDPEPLEEFALEKLAIAWTDPQRSLAKLVDPRGYAHLVTLGSLVGSNHGEIVHIGARHLLVLELFRDGNGGWRTATATIDLTREARDVRRARRTFTEGVFGDN